MSDLLNFDDDTDNLFKPAEQRAKPSKNLDDIFGTSSEAVTTGSNLDDVLVPGVQDDIFDVKPKSSPQKKSTARNVDSLFGDVDDEPDFFSTIPGKSVQQARVSEQTEDDLLADFLSSTESVKESEKIADEFDMFEEMSRHTGGGGIDIDDIFEANQVEHTSQFSVPAPVMESEDKENQSLDSLDMLLDAQPKGTVPASDELFSLIEPIKLTPDGFVKEPDNAASNADDINHILQANKSEVQTEPVDQSEHVEELQDTEHQSEDSLDMLLDAQPTGTVPVSDNLHCLIEPIIKTAADPNKRTADQGDITETRKLEVSVEPAVYEEPPNDEEEESDHSLKDLDHILDAQPEGTVPASDDLLSLVEPLTNIAASSNTHAAHSSDHKDLEEKGGDLLGSCGVEPSPEESSEQEEEKDQEVEERSEELEERSEEPVQSKPKTNLKKSMERSFEDLLNGLSDESEPELDDMIDDGIDNTNLESILGSPDKIINNIQSEVSPGEFVKPKRPLDDLFDMDFLSSTPNEKTAESVEVKVTTPEDEVYTMPDKEDENNVEWGNLGRDNRDDRIEGDVIMVEDTEVVMRHKPTAADDEQDLNLDVEDANYLDVDAHKHKSALGKQGSLALRRKPSRKSRRSLLSAGEDAIFQDSTEPKPTDLTNGDAEPGDDDGEERLDLSPPAKKPSPAMMLPLPGMAGRPPSQRLSSSPDDTEDNTAMDTKETKRLSKPPAGAFVLPALGPRPPKPQRPESITDKPPAESKPVMFEKPALKPVKPIEKPEQDEDLTPGFSPAGLRPTRRQEVEERGDSEEKDFTYKKPSLRSTPKPRDRSPEDTRERNSGLFEKPVLRSTPKPQIEQKPSEKKDAEVFETRNLRNVQKPVTETVIDNSEDRHVFDKPSLRSAGKRLESESDAVFTEPSSNQGAKLFEKPQLRTTNRDKRSDSTDDSKTEQVHTFNKPTLRSASRTTSESPGSEYSSPGIFEKPSLKKTTPSPDKETKDLYEPKGTFDRPALRKTQAAKEREERAKEKEKPEWLQEAANKHTKVLDVLQAKENQHGSGEKQVPSWLEKPALRKTRAQPLQDTSNGQSTHDGQSDTSEDTGKTSTPRSRNSSMGSENDPERKRTPATGAQNNYTPSWMRQQKSPAVPTGMTGLTPSKSLPSQSTTDEVPQWKLELAQRRQTRKGMPDEGQKKEEDSEPEWKKGVALRKTRNSITPSREVHKEEPEWKKAAEEKRARLRNSSAAGHSDHSGHS